jgi:polyhydroxybutyrate depolymerase
MRTNMASARLPSVLVALGLGCSTPGAGDEAASSEDTTAADAETTESSTSAPVSSDATSVASSGDTTVADPTDDADPTNDTGPPPSSCEVASLFEPGVHTGITIDVEGVSRSYDLFVPAGYDPAVAAPLVLNFHGLFGSPSQQAEFSQFDPTAEAHGMLVAYPEGIGASFNAGGCCGEASSAGVDDVGFARALVADVSAKMCVDPQRVYATGMSNGGHMAHRLACEAADLFAASASVAGLVWVQDCTPSRPISMIQFHGDADLIVGYSGVPEMMAAWAERNGCSPTSETTFEQGDMYCETWPGCDAGVEVSLCTIDGGGHCWPGNGSCIFGHSSTELHASEVIATMFDAQTLP